MRAFSALAAAGITVLAITACGSSSGNPAPPAHPAKAAAVTVKTPAAAVIARRIGAAGLPVRGLVVYTARTDPNHLLGRQGGYTSKAAWQAGGVEVYPDAAGCQARAAYLRTFQPPLGDGYDYTAGTAILRLSAELTPAQSKEWRAAFAKAAAS